MELWLKRFIKIVIILWFQQGSLGYKNLKSCKVESLNQEFPGTFVPEKLRFMLFYWPKASKPHDTLQYLTKSQQCLNGGGSRLQVTPCEVFNESQSWYQYQESLINIKSGLTLQVNASAIEFQFWNSSSTKWDCGEDTKNSLITIFTEVSRQRWYLSVASRTRKVMTSQNNSSGRWGIANYAGNRSNNFKPLCRKRGAFCGTPIPGLNSFPISSSTDKSRYLHIPAHLVEQALETGSKLCYAGGDFILIVCPLGFSVLNNRTKNYTTLYCLGDGIWSAPEPLYCVKRICGKAPRFPNTIMSIFGKQNGNEGDYGDVLLYTCEAPNYLGALFKLACGPDGNWVGSTPTVCKHRCFTTYTELQGEIRSLNYPSSYPPDITCNWTIVAPDNWRIALYFRDFFIEYGSILPPSCKYDALLIVDSGKVFETDYNGNVFCGSNNPTRWVSIGNTVSLIFISDDKKTAKGFKIEYLSWNYTASSAPTDPVRNQSFPEELDQTFVYIGEEYTSYYLEGGYALAVFILVSAIFFVIFGHAIDALKAWLYSDDKELNEIKKEFEPGRRRNAIAECDSHLKMHDRFLKGLLPEPRNRDSVMVRDSVLVTTPESSSKWSCPHEELLKKSVSNFATEFSPSSVVLGLADLADIDSEDDPSGRNSEGSNKSVASSKKQVRRARLVIAANNPKTKLDDRDEYL